MNLAAYGGWAFILSDLYFLFIATVLWRAMLAKKVAIPFSKVVPWLILYAILTAFTWYLWHYINFTLDYATTKILVASTIACLAPFVLAFFVPLAEVGLNYEKAVGLARIGGAGVAAGTLAQSGGNLIGNKSVARAGETAQGAGMAVGLVGMMCILDFKTRPWKYVHTAMIALIAILFIVFLIGYALGP